MEYHIPQLQHKAASDVENQVVSRVQKMGSHIRNCVNAVPNNYKLNLRLSELFSEISKLYKEW